MKNKIEDVINDKKKLYIRIGDAVTRELNRQKASGKKFITNEEIDC